jgi:hypothetical protein
LRGAMGASVIDLFRSFERAPEKRGRPSGRRIAILFLLA